MSLYTKDPIIPDYESEDIECLCSESGVESEWEWDDTQGAWICAGCGAVQ